ncbi:MAG: polysaccharide deacetylase family protein [Lachnospiraceae bacterium]|nr:polysaccharide deacetylase family protein [Lachnospiraceae bacterium]
MNKDKVRVLVILGELLVICIICVLFIIQGAPGSHRDEGTGSNVHAATIEGDGGDEPIPEENKALSPEEEAERLRLEKERLAEQERLAEEARLEAERKRIEEEKAAEAQRTAGSRDQAELCAAMYDYDGAIDTLKQIPDYEKMEEVTAAISTYESARTKLVKWEDNTKISHLFVHSLIVDTARAFRKGSSQPVGYNRYMTTVGEFKAMLESLYEKGYVLVSMHDIAERYVGEDGVEKLRRKDIYLPEGKMPLVISQDDVNYYAYMDNDGFADKLVIGEDGKPTCQYTDTDGTVSFGEYDVLPIVDNFVAEHPDFSYRGAKGILAVTGYEGALGYDTGWHMYDLDNPDEAAKLKAEQEAATAVAEAIKADGWEFASHSYTHTDMKKNSFEKVIYDTDKWEREVQPILGDTDLYIYPFGSDICDWRGYKGDKYEYLKKAGFWYFCNVDASQYWIQITDNYMRMGRINADGERMVKTPGKLDYFFDSAAILDKTRPALE